jgi:hypothetical protein
MTCRDGVVYESITWLIKNKVISDTPLAVAKFLLNTDGLTKKEIGEYLGDHVMISMTHAHHCILDSLWLNLCRSFIHYRTSLQLV